MEIRVKCGCGEGECPEWAIIELQGVVEPQSSLVADHLSNFRIGCLCRTSSDAEIYTFTVGYHELSGTKLPLRKPLLVLRKIHQSPSTDLQVVGIVRHRILFKSRPKALISSGPLVKEKKTSSLNGC